MTFAKEKAQNRCRIFFIFLTSVLVMLFATKSSPLYPFNDWVDANAYFTVGKSILKGYVPYRDLFDHKGPLLYFLHTLAAMVSFDSFLGVFIIEVIACFAFLWSAYKTLLLYTDKHCIFMIPFVAVFVYSLQSMCHGDSVEELSLPIFMYALYVGLKSIKENRIPNFKEGLIIGITSALVFWMKYSLLGMYLGWIVVPFILSIKNKQFPEFLKLLLSILLGILAVSAIVILYFAINHAVGDLFEVYFYDNLFIYNNSEQTSLATLFNVLLKGFLSVCEDIKLTLTTAVSLVCMFIFHKKNPLELAHIFLCFISMFFVIYVGGQYYRYYSLPFALFNIFWVCLVYELAKKLPQFFMVFRKKHMTKICGSGVLVLSVLMVYLFSNNSYMLFENKENLPQFKAKAYIESTGVKKPTVLNYGSFDWGLHTVLGIVPSNKYFFTPNMFIPALEAEHNDCIEKGAVDFVFVTNKIDLKNYELAECYTHYFEGYNQNYYLYQLTKTREDKQNDN